MEARHPIRITCGITAHLLQADVCKFRRQETRREKHDALQTWRDGLPGTHVEHHHGNT